MQQTGRFARSDRLLRAVDFQRVGRSRARNASKYFVVLVTDSSGEVVLASQSNSVRRLGITVSRKVGGAVERNRIKRSVREWFRRARMEWKGSIDVVVIARRDAVSLSGVEIARTLSQQLDAAARATAHEGRGTR